MSYLVGENPQQSGERASWRCRRVAVLLWFAVVDTPPISSHDDMTVLEQMYCVGRRRVVLYLASFLETKRIPLLLFLHTHISLTE